MQNARFVYRNRKKKKVLCFVMILLLSASVTLLLLRPAVCRSKVNHITAAATKMISSVIGQALQANEAYFQITELDGKIALISLNTPQISKLQLTVEQVLTQKLEEGTEYRFSEPLGTYLGSEMFMTQGPMIPVEILLLGTAKTALGTDIESVGINQTRYRLRLSVVCTLHTGLYTGAKQITVSGDYTVAEVMVVGDVPQMDLSFVEGISP